jgi:uncharacterized protein YjbI with pentapeptide repeats
MLFLTIAIGVIIVASVTLPQVFTPSTHAVVIANNNTAVSVYFLNLSVSPNVTNTTALNPVNSTGYQNATFYVPYIIASPGANLTIAFNHNYTPNYTILYDPFLATAIGNFTAADNSSNISTVAIPGVDLSTANITNGWILRLQYNTSSALTEVNITSANLSYINYTLKSPQNVTFTTSNMYAAAGAYLTIAYNHNYTPNYTFLTNMSGAGGSIGNFSAAANNASNVSTLAISGAYLNSTGSVQSFMYFTLSLLTRVDITGANLTYYQLSSQQLSGWDAGSTAMWAIVPLVIIAFLILIIINGRR